MGAGLLVWTCLANAADAAPAPSLGADLRQLPAMVGDGPAAPSVASIEQQFRAGEQGLALQRLQQALAQHPRDARLRFLQGVLMSEMGRNGDAVTTFQRLTEEFPELPEPYNNLAVLQAGQGQLDSALALLQTALRLAPDYRTARENLGDVHLRLALRAYAQAAQGAPDGSTLAHKLRQARELALVR